MESIQVTKYNPEYRDKDGVYLRDEWTSRSDVNNIYQGKVFTIEEYLVVENKYIKCIEIFLKEKNISRLQICDLEYISEELPIYLEEGAWINLSQLKQVVQLILREEIWCKLISGCQCEIHFGYDYYMYFVGESISKGIIDNLKEVNGMYVERRKSPYID